MNEPEILPTAHRHGITDDDILHAWRNPLRYLTGNNEMPFLIGPAYDGTILEIGFQTATYPDPQVIVHADRCRPQFLPR